MGVKFEKKLYVQQVFSRNIQFFFVTLFRVLNEEILQSMYDAYGIVHCRYKGTGANLIFGRTASVSCSWIGRRFCILLSMKLKAKTAR